MDNTEVIETIEEPVVEEPVVETEPAIEEPVVEEPVDVPAEEPRRRSRVGSMFEQLSFGDVD